MRLQIMSDLHFEMHADGGAGLICELDPTGVDVLVLAGDITMARHYANLESVFKPLARPSLACPASRTLPTSRWPRPESTSCSSRWRPRCRESPPTEAAANSSRRKPCESLTPHRQLRSDRLPSALKRRMTSFVMSGWGRTKTTMLSCDRSRTSDRFSVLAMALTIRWRRG